MFWDSSPKSLAIFRDWKNCQNVTAIPFLTVGLSKKSKSIRPNRLCLNSYAGPYRSLQCGHLELSRTCRNDVGTSIFLFDHTMPNLTGTTLRGAPVQKYSDYQRPSGPLLSVLPFNPHMYVHKYLRQVHTYLHTT